MSSYNKVLLAGHLTRDPETRYIPNGTCVADFSLAVNRKWKTEAGELQEEVSFFNCVAFGNRAETIAKYFFKGSPIFIEGRLKQETWEDKQTGQKRQAVKVIVNGFMFMGGKQREGAAESEPAMKRPPRPAEAAAAPAAGGASGYEEDNVPF